MPRQSISYQRLIMELLPLESLTESRRREIRTALAHQDGPALERATHEALRELVSEGRIRAQTQGLPEGDVRYVFPKGASLVVVGGARTAPGRSGFHRYPPGHVWKEPASPEALRDLLHLHEELLTGDRSSLRSPKELLRTLIEQAERILPASRMAWVLLPEWSPGSDWDGSWMLRPSALEEIEDVYHEGSIVVWDDLAVPGAPASEGMRSLAAVRVGAPGTEWSAVLEAWSAAPHHFTEARLHLLQIIADEISLLLRQLLTLQRFVFLDALTSLYNRAYYEMQMRRELARAQRDREPMALLLCDVDNFKRFNTQYGYAGGDGVLRGVASILQKAVRPFDSVARYGGEEFVVILTAPVGRNDARTIADRLRQAVSQARFEITDLEKQKRIVGVTVSVGVALFPEDAQGETDLWNKANTAVLQAKSTGKNRVLFWGEHVQQEN